MPVGTDCQGVSRAHRFPLYAHASPESPIRILAGFRSPAYGINTVSHRNGVERMSYRERRFGHACTPSRALIHGSDASQNNRKSRGVPTH